MKFNFEPSTRTSVTQMIYEAELNIIVFLLISYFYNITETTLDRVQRYL